MFLLRRDIDAGTEVIEPASVDERLFMSVRQAGGKCSEMPEF
jgi:hypothetical protein